MQCVLYARVSTDKQAERALSIPAQLQAMKEYAARFGWTVVDEFVENGASARTTDRPELRRLLVRCKEIPAVDFVLVHKLDRLARSVIDHATIKAVLLKQNTKIASVVENVDDSVSGQLVENILASIAQFYSANLAEEVKKGMRVLVERGGWPHKPPRGYLPSRNATGTSCPRIDDSVAPMVRKAFELYGTGSYSLKALINQLAADGLKTASGRPIPASYLRAMLENPFYVGRTRWNGRERVGLHQGLIAQELFDRVQGVLRARFKDSGEKGRYRFLLRGVAVCGECGWRVTAENHKGRASYYRCIKHTISRSMCQGRFSRVDDAHASLYALYDRLQVSEDLKAALRDVVRRFASDRLDAFRAVRDSERTRLARLTEQEMRLGEAFSQGVMTGPVYKKVAKKVRDAIVSIEQQIERARINPDSLNEKLEDVLKFASCLSDIERSLASVEEKQTLLKTVFKALILAEGEIVGYTLNEPFNHLLTEVPPSAHLRKQQSSGTGMLSPHVENPAITSAIKSVLDSDTTFINRFRVDHSNEDKAA